MAGKFRFLQVYIINFLHRKLTVQFHQLQLFGIINCKAQFADYLSGYVLYTYVYSLQYALQFGVIDFCIWIFDIYMKFNFCFLGGWLISFQQKQLLMTYICIYNIYISLNRCHDRHNAWHVVTRCHDRHDTRHNVWAWLGLTVQCSNSGLACATVRPRLEPLGNHRVLVTYPRPGTQQSSPALAIIDLRQLRLWLRVTRHRLLLLVLAPWQEPL